MPRAASGAFGSPRALAFTSPHRLPSVSCLELSITNIRGGARGIQKLLVFIESQKEDEAQEETKQERTETESAGRGGGKPSSTPGSR